MQTTAEIEPMARKAAPKTIPVRLTEEAIGWAKIASGYTKESMAEYICRIVVEFAKADADRLHAETYGETRPKTKGGKA